jgi:hypothetical protein
MIYILLFVLSAKTSNFSRTIINGAPVQIPFKTMKECLYQGTLLSKKYGKFMGPSVCIEKERT